MVTCAMYHCTTITEFRVTVTSMTISIACTRHPVTIGIEFRTRLGIKNVSTGEPLSSAFWSTVE